MRGNIVEQRVAQRLIQQAVGESHEASLAHGQDPLGIVVTT